MSVDDKTLRLAELVVQIGGMIYLVFKIGRWTGSSEGKFASIEDAIKELKHEQHSHAEDDEHKHDNVQKTLTAIQISIAMQGRK